VFFAHCKYPALKGDMKLWSLTENSKNDLPVWEIPRLFTLGNL
jgi:hypothetical protein